MDTENARNDDYTMEFDPTSIKHMGLQMYSALPAVITELVAKLLGRQRQQGGYPATGNAHWVG